MQRTLLMTALGQMLWCSCSSASAPTPPVAAGDEKTDNEPSRTAARRAAPGRASSARPAPRSVWKSSGPFLEDSAQDTLRKWTSFRRLGRTAVTAGRFVESENSSALGYELELPVIEESADTVRVVDEQYGVRFALYVEKRDLESRPADRVFLSSTPDAGAPRLPVELAGGAEVDIVERDDDWLRVEFQEEGVQVGGFLPTAIMQPVFILSDHDVDDPGSNLYLLRSTQVFDWPGGKQIAVLERIDDPTMRSLRQLGQARDGFVEVEVLTRRLRVQGFVRAGDVDSPHGRPAGLFGGLGMTWGASPTFWLDLPEDTLIHESPDGPIFALTTVDNSTVAWNDKRSGDWVQIRFRTRWRMLEGWVMCPAVRPTTSGHYECTTRDDPDAVVPDPR